MASTDGTGARAELDALRKGDRLDAYVILDELGSGGAGRVYAAYDPRLDRRVALKLLHDGPLDDGETEHPLWARLVREARAIARLTHPNVLVVHNVGWHDGRAWLASELVDGADLRTWLDHKPPRRQREVLDVFVAAGAGLRAAHAAGVVHGDFKPTNVLVGSDGRPRVADFGLASLQRAESTRPDVRRVALGSNDGGLDVVGASTPAQLRGTPYYMAPEQFDGGPATEASDQYAFCLALGEALLGFELFDAPSVPALVEHKSRPPAELLAAGRSPLTPAWLRKIVERGLSVEPRARFASMDELLAAITVARRRRRRWRTGALVVGGGLAAAGAAAWFGGVEPCTGADRHIEQVWNDGSRAGLERAFAAANPELGPQTAPRVVAELDAYAQRWTAAHREACLASVYGEQSDEIRQARMRCLDDRRGRLGALAHALSDADQSAVVHAVRASSSLSSIDPCGDAEAVVETFEAPVPEHAAALAEIDADIHRVEALVQIAAFSKAMELARAAIERAAALPAKGRDAALRLHLGRALLVTGDLEGAEAQLEAAALGGLATGRDTIALEAVVAIVRTLGEFQARYDDAMAWVKWGDPLIERTAAGPSLRAALRGARGSLHAKVGELDDAAKALERAVEIVTEAKGPDALNVAVLEVRLGEVLRDKGDSPRARTVLEHALGVIERELGDNHPEVGAALNLLGTVLSNLGEPEAGLAAVTRALSITRATFGPDHPGTAMVANNLAMLKADRGQLQEAVDLLVEILPAQRQRLGDKHPLVAHLLLNIGGLNIELGRNAEALEYLEEAERLARAIHKPDHPVLVDILENKKLALAGGSPH